MLKLINGVGIVAHTLAYGTLYGLGWIASKVIRRLPL